MRRVLFMMLLAALSLPIKAGRGAKMVWNCILGESRQQDVKKVLEDNKLDIWKEDSEWLYADGEFEYKGFLWNSVDACFPNNGALMSLYFHSNVSDDSAYYKVEKWLKANYKKYKNISSAPYVIQTFRRVYYHPGSHLMARAHGNQVIVLYYIDNHLTLIFTDLSTAE